MALIPCPHCDRHVRDDEASCPFCDKRLKPRKAGLGAAVIAGAALISPACSGDKKEVTNPDPDPPPADASPVEQPPIDAAAPPPPPDDREPDPKPYGAPPSRDRLA